MGYFSHFKGWRNLSVLGLVAFCAFAPANDALAWSSESPANLPLLVFEGGASGAGNTYLASGFEDPTLAFAQLADDLDGARTFGFGNAGNRGASGGRSRGFGPGGGTTTTPTTPVPTPTTNPSPVPLPATGFLLVGCLSAIAIVGMRRKSCG